VSSPSLPPLLLSLPSLPLRYDPGVQQFACWAICNLALADEENKQKMRRSGILEVCCFATHPSLPSPQQMCHIALETHENNLEVVRQARHTIAVLGISEESRPKSKRKPTHLKPVTATPVAAGNGSRKETKPLRK
jgi:hypothetical protein